MSAKEIQKLLVITTACLTVLLIAAAFLFSTFFEGRGKNVFYSGASSPCQGDNRANAVSDATDTLTPLDPSQEELLSGNGALAPAEVLGLHDDLDEVGQLNNPPPAPLVLRWKALEGAQAYQVQAWQIDGKQKLILFDGQTKSTEIELKRRISGDVYWQVAGIDSSGQPGDIAGPTIVHDRAPASK